MLPYWSTQRLLIVRAGNRRRTHATGEATFDNIDSEAAHPAV